MTPRPYWPAMTGEAMQPDNLPRVLAAMGFDRHCGTIPRGSIAWWRPDYITIRMPERFPPAADPAAQSASYRARRVADLGPVNRWMRDSEVHLLASGDRIICVDTGAGDGEWRSADGANRGRDLIDLGMWRWSCKFGQSASRIQKIIGMAAIPQVKDAA